MVFSKSAPIFVLLAASAEGIKVPNLRGGSGGSVSLHMYRHDCGHSSGFSFAQRNPGAGMTPGDIKPFETVLKDGFYAVDCVKDYMFQHGDKFGDNKVSYKLGDLTNVSIVHYANHVPKEDRQEMTHEACFRFCRTVPDMLFFGLSNGRECYCTPYFEAEASDSSDCDAVCDGDKGTMCGGKTKSSIFGMHQCANTKADLESAIQNMGELLHFMDGANGALKTMSDTMQGTAKTYQDKFGQAGDPGASDLMQAAKVRAGVLAELLRRGVKVVDAAKAVEAAATAMAQADFTKSVEVTKAEEIVKSAEKSSADLTSLMEEHQEVMDVEGQLSEEQDTTLASAPKQYYPAMYFVDKKFEESPSTCTGEASEETLAVSFDACARACDNDLHECVAFQFVKASGLGAAAQGPAYLNNPGVCSLFSKLKTIRYYTGCSEQGGHGDVRCMAKVSKFEGTSIAPNPSGKCKGCLKEAKQADRCFE